MINNSNLYSKYETQDLKLETFNKDISNGDGDSKIQVPATNEETKAPIGRENWGKSIEFLLSCIAMSVGLGNIWRFPISALRNGKKTTSNIIPSRPLLH